jgi:hypothetical protein
VVNEVIERVLERMREEGILIKDMPSILNRYLPDGEKLSEGRSGAVQVSRWLALEKDYSVQPRGNVLIALMQFTIKTHEN